TANGTITQAEVVAAFADLSAGTTGTNTSSITWSGALTDFSSGAASGTSVTFTSTTANSNVADLSVSGTAAPTITTTDGVVPVATNITESSSVAFNAANMSKGDQITIGGLTLTASGNITQAEAIAAFANLSAGATAGNTVTNGTWSGTLGNFSSGAASGTAVTFSSTTANSNVADLEVSATQQAAGSVAVPSTYALTFGIDGQTYDIDMTSSTTLTQLKDMINDKTGGKMTASILNVGGTNPFKLVIKSNDVGASNAISFSSTSTSALENLGLDATTLAIAGGNHLQSATDASFSYNGVNISRSTNTISDLISGVTITLNEKQTDAATLSNVSIKQDLSSLKDNLTSFVSKYNELMSNLKITTKYDSDTKVAGIFQSTSQVKSLSTSINRQLLATDELGRSILDYGISLDETGILKFDSSIYDAKIKSSAIDVEDFFRGSTKSFATNYTGSAITTSALNFTASDMSINGINIAFSTTGVDAATNALALKNAINAAGIEGIEAIIGENNNIQLVSAAGYDIAITGDTTKLSSVGLVATTTTGSSTIRTGFFTKLDDILKSYVVGSTSIFSSFNTQLETEKTSLTKQRLANVKKLDDRYNAMAVKFAAYDSIISKLNTQFETLSQQIQASYSSN
ncbi:MAG: flagellar filament capping protein FliD, partial [Campylobacteraceae bacterium]|nr:flagellar filament capping protein FliD [Campylobacteraceae bacterium]